MFLTRVAPDNVFRIKIAPRSQRDEEQASRRRVGAPAHPSHREIYMETFKELFEETLKDIYYAEKAILKALPKMAKKASSKKLQDRLHQASQRDREAGRSP